MADVKGFLKKAFPFISLAASFGGPVGAMAAAAVGKALGIDKVDTTEEGITEALANATPDQVIALKQAEMEFQAHLKELDIDLESIAEADRASARDREVQTRDLTPRIMGGGVMIGFLIAVFMVLSGHAKADSVMAGTLIGYLSAKAELVLAYYFGSSAGSDRKTEIIANGNGNPH